MTEIERLAKVTADYFRHKRDEHEVRDAEEMGAVLARSDTVLGYIDVGRTDCAEIVRSILQAMREPSEGMRTVGRAVEVAPREGCWTQDIGDFAATAVWQAMIDHILSEAP